MWANSPLMVAIYPPRAASAHSRNATWEAGRDPAVPWFSETSHLWPGSEWMVGLRRVSPGSQEEGERVTHLPDSYSVISAPSPPCRLRVRGETRDNGMK